MKFSRRALLAGASAFAIVRFSPSGARLPHGTNTVPINHGWNTLPLGAGGLVTGLHIASDGSMVCRTDVGNIYRWSGKSTDYADGTKKWLPLLNFNSLPGATTILNIGAWEHVLAPGNSAVHLAIFCDMTSLNKNWLWYSTDSGGTWHQTNIAFINGTAGSNDGATKLQYYKIAIDPANSNVAYCGMPFNSGNSGGVWTSLNQSGGSTLATWAAVTTNGVTAIASPTSGGVLSCGLAIDSSQGTTTVGGQTVTKHIILPVGGVGIYESTDGGVSFTEIAVTPFGTSSFTVVNGGFTAAGVYYCIVQHASIGGIWRYASGTWTNITSGTYSAGTFGPGIFLIIDPTNNAYLSVTGGNGMGAGFTSTNANTGTPTWVGLTGGQIPTLLGASYDLLWIDFIFGQGSGGFTDASGCVVDASGNCFFGGNQSFFYFGTSAVNATANGVPHYTASLYASFWWSMGRGQEATVAQDVLCSPGGTYPILGCQDLGGVLRGTFTTYPQQVYRQFQEYSGNSLEYAASDSSFIVACITGQNNNPNAFDDSPAYSTNYGVDGSWNQVTSASSLYSGVGMAGGQIVAVDHDHWVRAVQFNGSTATVPCFTTNATSGLSATWTLCTGLPSANYFLSSWSNGNSFKPLAVGYGADLNTVWALVLSVGGTSATIYRSTDKGANWSSIITWTSSAQVVGPFLASVPGFTGELWATGRYTGGSVGQFGLWHITAANTASATKTQITLPVDADLPIAFTLGAPSSGGGYPALYLVGTQSGSGGTAPVYIYRGIISGSGASMTVAWTRFGPTGAMADLPASCQLAGIQTVRGDWNVYGRIYIASNQTGFSYYNP